MTSGNNIIDFNYYVTYASWRIGNRYVEHMNNIHYSSCSISTSTPSNSLNSSMPSSVRLRHSCQLEFGSLDAIGVKNTYDTPKIMGGRDLVEG